MYALVVCGCLFVACMLGLALALAASAVYVRSVSKAIVRVANLPGPDADGAAKSLARVLGAVPDLPEEEGIPTRGSNSYLFTRPPGGVFGRARALLNRVLDLLLATRKG
jgi:hypothetical protein